MIGDRYWSTGIILRYDGRSSWSAMAEFFDNGFCDDESTEGRLHTRYYVSLETAIDVVIADAEKLGIEFNKNTGGKAILMVRGDGEYEDCPLPENWKEILEQQAARIGWASAYGVADMEAVEAALKGPDPKDVIATLKNALQLLHFQCTSEQHAHREAETALALLSKYETATTNE